MKKENPEIQQEKNIKKGKNRRRKHFLMKNTRKKEILERWGKNKRKS